MTGRQALFVSHPQSHSPSSRRWAIAAALAFAGALNPLPLPMTGLHKFFLGQPVWGGVYLLLGWTQIPRIACAVEAILYLNRFRQSESADRGSAGGVSADGTVISQHTQAIADALRELDKLRQEGLISEHEFEQSRRSLLTKLS